MRRPSSIWAPCTAGWLAILMIVSGVLGLGGTSHAVTISARCKHQVQSGSAAFVIDGNQVLSTSGTSCRYTFELQGDRRFNYSGPTGCKGQYFYSIVDEFKFDFRYSAHDAYLIWNQKIYHFINGPQQQGQVLVVDQQFSDHEIAVRINCPPPRPSRPLLPANY